MGEWRLALKRKRMNEMKRNGRGLGPTNGGRRACREQERMFHSSPSHTSRPAHQLSLSVGLSQHVPDASPSHLLHRQVATQDTRPSLSYRQTLLTDPSASVLAPY